MQMPQDLGIEQITKLTESSQLGFWDRQVQKLDTIMRMWFLAFTADQSFCREMEYAYNQPETVEGGLPILGTFLCVFGCKIAPFCVFVGSELSILDLYVLSLLVS